MQNCLTDYIGIYGLGGTEPESGRYINDLPGVPLELLEKLSDPERNTLVEVWNKIQRREIPKFLTLFNSVMRERFALNVIETSIDMLKYIDKASNFNADAKYYGTVVQLVSKNKYHIVSSNFHCINVQEVNMYFHANVVDVPFKIFDLATGVVLHETTITKSAGWNRIAVNKQFFAYRIFICIDATGIELVNQSIRDEVQNFFYNYTYTFYNQNTGGFLRGGTAAVADEITDDDITLGYDIFGISPVFTVECSYLPLLCKNKFAFATALQYHLAAGICFERIHSPKYNFFTAIKTDNVKELYDMYVNEAKAEIKLVSRTVNINLNDPCIKCNDPITVHETHL